MMCHLAEFAARFEYYVKKYFKSVLTLFSQDQRGSPLERWQMCTKEEEHMVLQHFLRFGETRSITQQLIFQELSEKQDQGHGHQGPDHQAKAALAAHRAAQSELKKFQSAMAQNMARAAAAAASMSPNGLPPPTAASRGDVSPR